MVGSNPSRWVSRGRHTHTSAGGVSHAPPPGPPFITHNGPPLMCLLEAQTHSCSRSTWGTRPPARPARVGLRRMMRHPPGATWPPSPLLVEGEERGSRQRVEKGARDVCHVLGKNSVRLEDGPRVHAPRSSCPTDCPPLPLPPQMHGLPGEMRLQRACF